MALSHHVKALIATLAVVASLSMTQSADLRAQPQCIQCLGSYGCRASCNCTCHDPSLSFYATGCNSDGTLQFSCVDYSTNPPTSYGATCQFGFCECVPDNGICNTDLDCCQGTCQPATGRCNGEGTPILINLRNNSPNYHLTSASNGVLFDFFADGVPRRVSWTEADSDIAFLVRDLNGNGRVDDGSELFSNVTATQYGQPAINGFEVLRELDATVGNQDGKIDLSDPVYEELRLWQDRNHNGESEPDELTALGEAGVKAIFVEYRESARRDRHGNRYKYVGDAIVAQNGHERLRRIFDVYLTFSASTD